MFEQVMKPTIGRAVGSLSPLLLIATLVAGCSSTGTTNGLRPTPSTAAPDTTTATPEVTATAPSSNQGTPEARGYPMMADLPGELGVLMLGGLDHAGPPDLPDMWTYDSESGWQDITPSALPELPEYGPGVIGDAFEFDPGSGIGVFVDIEGNTFTYDPEANTWESKETEGGPKELLGASMVHDAESDRMIVFGGFSFDSGYNDKTWAYDLDSNTWERMHPRESPSPRNYYQMAYDPRSDRVILFGGSDDFDAFDDTWAYDYEADAWTKLTPATRPAGRTDGWMVYDPRGRRMILFGGITYPAEEPFGDTWAFDPKAQTWIELDSSGPSARGWHAMAYDAQAKMIVLFGGGPTREEFTAETWIYDPRANTWSQVA